MLLPSKIDLWWAEAVTRVYAPWLTAGCVGERQRREVAELLRRARRVACLPPLDPPVTHPQARPYAPGRAHTGRWTRSAA